MARRSTSIARGDHVILSRATTKTKKSSNTKWDFVWSDEAELAPWFDAIDLLARVCDRLLLEHRKSILAGNRPDGGKQPPLEGAQAERAKSGQRPPHRGSTGKINGLPNSIIRTKISFSGKVSKIGGGRSGTVARATIKPPGKFGAWLNREDQRGHEYFGLGGAMQAAMDDEIAKYLEAAIQGKPAKPPAEGEKTSR
jgi:hypothetical protein